MTMLSSSGVLVISGLMFGGGQRVVLDLREALSDRAPALCLLGCEGSCKELGAEFVVGFDGRYNSPLSVAKTSSALRRTLIASSPNFVHSHGWDADMLTWLATSGLKTKRIVHLHVTPDFLYSGALKHRLRQRLAANILRRAWRVIAVSYAVRVHWCEALGLPLDRIIVVHNGVDTRRFSPRSPDADVIHSRLVIGVAARLAPMKGLDVLIRAISLLRKRGVEADLRIAGDGGLRSALEALSREIGVADCVRFLGQIDDMSEFYHGLDLFVLPSVAMEGLPLGILEAMASGLPVVATRVAGAPEAVEDGVEGLLVPPGDEEALADAIARLAGDSMLRARMGINGRRRAEESFSLVAFADRMAAVYFGGR